LKQITLRDAEGDQPQIGMGMEGIGKSGRRMSARSLLKQALGPGEILPLDRIAEIIRERNW